MINEYEMKDCQICFCEFRNAVEEMQGFRIKMNVNILNVCFVPA